MFFKGGKKFTTPKAVAESVDQFGGEFNAYTGEDYAGYYVKAAPEYVHQALDVLADMMLDAQFPKDELEREKGVVIQELKMYEDMPQKLVMDKWKQFYYGDTSFGWSIIGTENNILSFNQEMLQKHKHELYTKDNLIIVVGGNITDQQALEDHIATAFVALPAVMQTQRPVFQHILPTEKTGFTDKKTEQNHVIISAKGFDLNNDQKYAASLLGVILGGNMSSRLFQNIREKQGLCYYIGASHHSDIDEGLFMIRGGMDKARFDFGIDAIYKEIADIASGNIDPQELQKALGYMSGKTQMGIESSDEMSSFIGEQYLIKGEIKTLDQILENYKKVTLDDVKKVASALEKTQLYQYHIQ